MARGGVPAVPLALAVALLMTAVLAGPAAADHVACGATITEDTTLDSDVGPCPGDGLIVTADDITLDLGGHTVSAANGDGDHAGVRLARVAGVTVQNGTVTGFDAGVVIGGGAGNTVQQVSAVDNANDMQQEPCLLGEGIAILNSRDNTITRSELRNNGPFGGVSVVGDSDANTIDRNEIHDNNVVSTGGGCGRADQAEGVRVEGPGADGNLVDGNTVTNSLLAGIGLHGYVCSPVDPDAPPQDPNTGNVVVRNSVSGTAGSLSDGVAILQQGPADVVCPAFASTIAHNIATDNAGNGIFVSANSHDNHIRRNVVERNGGSGVYLHGPRMATRAPLLSDPPPDPEVPDLDANEVMDAVVDTLIEEYEAAPGAYDNVLLRNVGQGNGGSDGFDGNEDCDNNRWRRNEFGTVNQPCVGAGGSGESRGQSGEAPGRQDGGDLEHNRARGSP